MAETATAHLARVVDAAAAAGNAYIEQAAPVIKAFSDTIYRVYGPTLARYALAGHMLTVSFLQPAEYRRHRRRCAACNPAGNPRPQRGHYKPGPKAARITRRR